MVASTVKRVLQNKINDRENLDYCPLIIGGSPEIIKIKKRIPSLASVNEAVLIQGERGTGKELIARYIHQFRCQFDRAIKGYLFVPSSLFPRCQDIGK